MKYNEIIAQALKVDSEELIKIVQQSVKSGDIKKNDVPHILFTCGMIKGMAEGISGGAEMNYKTALGFLRRGYGVKNSIFKYKQIKEEDGKFKIYCKGVNDKDWFKVPKVEIIDDFEKKLRWQLLEEE